MASMHRFQLLTPRQTSPFKNILYLFDRQRWNSVPSCFFPPRLSARARPVDKNSVQVSHISDRSSTNSCFPGSAPAGGWHQDLELGINQALYCGTWHPNGCLHHWVECLSQLTFVCFYLRGRQKRNACSHLLDRSTVLELLWIEAEAGSWKLQPSVAH